MNEGARTALLRRELIVRMNQGWTAFEGSPKFELRMQHDVSPPAWRMLVELINPLFWLGFGTPTYPLVRRTLHVRVDEQGVLHRRTTGKLPARWPRGDWEVADTIEPAAPATDPKSDTSE